MRILSFLPSATEIVCALGLTNQLVGITHECDYPASVAGKPVVVRNAIDLEFLSPHEIDQVVSREATIGASLYRVDEALVRQLAPDLILAQDLCQVCAPSGNELTHVLASLNGRPKVLWLTPKSLSDIEQNIREIGVVTNRQKEAEALVSDGHQRLQALSKALLSVNTRPRVFCVEWIDPIYCSGHWIAEMVALAGGNDRLARPGENSVRIPWSDVLAWDPEVLIVAPCGYRADAARDQALLLSKNPGWNHLTAVRQRRVYTVDANAYLARPGPRVVDGIELLAHLIHPRLLEWAGADDAFTSFSAEETLQRTVAGIPSRKSSG